MDAPIRRPIRWRRWLLAIVAGVVTLAVVGGVLLWQRAAAFNERVSSAPMLSSAMLGPLNSNGRVNILLVGYAKVGSGAFLTDSMTLLSVNPVTDATTAIAIPRDLWIENHAGLPGNGKINEAFAVGYHNGGYEEGGSRAIQLVGDVTGLPIHGWIALDFDGFREMVDAVGGVTVENPTAFAYPLDSSEREGGNYSGFFPDGRIELNGEDALAYVRARYADVAEEQGDFARANRQHRVLAAIRDKLTSGGTASIPRWLSLTEALSGGLRTNLSVLDLYLVSSHLSPDRRIELTEGEILAATQNTAGQYILVVIDSAGPGDYGPLQSFIEERLRTDH